MRVVILNQFFYPDHSATSQLMTDLAESLVERGVAVTAISGRGRYNGGERLPARGAHKGVRIERAWSTSYGKRRMAGRIADYLSFYLGATWTLARLPRHDVVMALTTPPLIGLVALFVGRLRRMRVVALVQDVYPDVAVHLGTLRAGSLATRLFDRLNRFLLRRVERVVVLGECMREVIEAKLGDSAPVDVIHNWADEASFASCPAREANPFVVEHGLRNKFVVLFSGNLGLVNEFSTVLDAAERLRDREDIVFLFVGEGARSTDISACVRDRRLPNVRLLPYQPRKRLRESLGAGDALLVTLADGLAGLSVPSKTYGILAAGRPVLFVGDSRSSVARLIAEHKCGAAFEMGEGARLARTIAGWASDRREVEALGARARHLFEQKFNRTQAVEAYLKTFERCLRTETAEAEHARAAAEGATT